MTCFLIFLFNLVLVILITFYDEEKGDGDI